ncbi:MAG: hypothetical protein HYX76_13555, partial [Acidobacteria bacterium]|nr:hypothetical protein [Acidobacteriota bacterium]
MVAMRSSDAPRVAITGIGVVSPFGVGRERYWEHVTRGCSGVRTITEFDVSTFPCRVAAPVPAVSITDAVELPGEEGGDGDGERGTRADPKRYARASLIGVLAAREAWHDAGLRVREPGAGVI